MILLSSKFKSINNYLSYFPHQMMGLTHSQHGYDRSEDPGTYALYWIEKQNQEQKAYKMKGFPPPTTVFCFMQNGCRIPTATAEARAERTNSDVDREAFNKVKKRISSLKRKAIPS